MATGITDPITIAMQFNNCINSRDIKGLSALMSADHVFSDTTGNHFKGKEKCTTAWSGFFMMFPDYQNIFEATTSKGDTAYIQGYSTCSDKRLEGKCLWTATVQHEKVTEWRVYTDDEDNRRKLGW